MRPWLLPLLSTAMDQQHCWRDCWGWRCDISHTIGLTLTNWLRKSAFGVLVLCAISGTQDSPASFSWTATSSSQTLYFTDQSPPISRWTYSWTGSHVTGRVGEALVCSYHLRYDNCPISISRLFRMSH